MAAINPFEDDTVNPFEEEPKAVPKQEKKTLSSGGLAKEAALEGGKALLKEAGKGALATMEVVGGAVTAPVSKAIVGIGELVGLTPADKAVGEKIKEIGEAAQFQPVSELGKTATELAATPFEMWHEGSVYAGDKVFDATLGFLKEQFGMSDEDAGATAAAFATTAYTALDAIPWVAGLTQGFGKPEALPKAPHETGFVPPGFKTSEELAAADKGKKTWTTYEKDPFPDVKESEYSFADRDGNPVRGSAVEIPIKNEKGDAVGHIAADLREGADTVQVSVATYDTLGERVPGAGTKAYTQLADWALSKGKKLGSDKEVSLEASHVYEKLQKNGYSVEQNPTARLEITYDAQGNAFASMRTEDGKPVFSVTGKGDSAPLNIGAVQEAITMDSKGVKSITPETPMPIIENATGKAIREAVAAKRAEDAIVQKGLTFDERPLVEVLPELATSTAEKMEDGTTRRTYKGTRADLPDRFSTEAGLQNIVTNPENLIPPQVIFRYRDNPFIKWTMSLINKQDRVINRRLESIFYAPEIKLRAGARISRKPTSHGLKSGREAMSIAEQNKLAREAWTYDDVNATKLPSREELSSRGWTPRMMNWYYNFHAHKSQLIEALNKQGRVDNPNWVDIKDAPGVLPHMWDQSAAFRVALRKKGDKTAHIQLAAKSAKEAEQLKAMLEKQYGIDKFEVGINQRKVDKQMERNMSARAISEAIEQVRARGLAEGTPAEITSKVVEQLQSRQGRGIGVHSRERTGARGFMGDEWTSALGDTWSKNKAQLTTEFFDAMDAFITGAVRTEGYYEIKKGLKDANASPMLRELYPNSLKFANTFADNYFGRETFLDGQLKKVIGEYSGGIKAVTSPILYAKILFWNVGQILANSAQFAMALPRAWREAEAGKEGRQVAKATFKAAKDLVFPTAEKKASLKWASDNFVVSQNFIRMMEDQDFARSVFSNPHALWDISSGRMAANIIEESTRLTAFNIYENLLLDRGVPPAIARKDAANLVDISQVNYNFHERGLMWAGDIGRLPGQFKTWSSNWIGQLAEYTKDASRGEVEPLIGFLGASGAVSGLVGMVGVQEADTAVELYNKMTGSNVTLPSTAIALHAPDWAAYGPIQATTNFHTGTFQLPQATVNSLFYVPGYNFYKPIAEDLYNMTLKAVGASDVPFTKLDWQRFVWDTAPTSMRGTLNMMFELGEIKLLKPGETRVYHDPRTGEALATIDWKDERAKILGGDTLKMSTMKNMLYTIQRMDQNRKNTLDAWADYVAVTQVLYKAPLDLQPFYKVAADFGVSGKEFNKMIKERAKKILRDRNIRAIKGSLGKRHIDELKPYLDDLSAREEAKGSFEEGVNPFE